MAFPKFFVVARVVGRDGALPLWKDRLVHLCDVSVTERYGDSYYWGQDLDGEPDTLWGLEGYTHPVGFFLDHVSSDVFKREMALVDSDELLRHEQGLQSRDYDLHHYDFEGGWLKRATDPDAASTTSHVAVFHLWAVADEKRDQVMRLLTAFSERMTGQDTIQSCAVLKECRDLTMTTLWLRLKSKEAFGAFQSSGSFQALMTDIDPLIARTELHRSKAFNGHLDLK